jgi:thiosulfate/3-mercaptopyruvate sulfurtransferase
VNGEEVTGETSYTTLVSARPLSLHLADPDWAVVDCRYRLADLTFGRTAYAASHIPGAVFADILDDLSGPVVPGRTGRHPLPDVAALAGRLSAWGIDRAVQVVAYDDRGGAMAARLWWLLRWLGHEQVAVLDGGWPAWLDAGFPVRGDLETRAVRRFMPAVRPELLAEVGLVARVRQDPAWCVLDARAAERFRGENETIDRVAGRVPGAVSAPYADNLAPDGRFKPAAELRERYAGLLGDVSAAHAVCYCGSGVTAAHDLLALAHAGLGEGRLYAGSWSEWITDPSRPVATG